MAIAFKLSEVKVEPRNPEFILLSRSLTIIEPQPAAFSVLADTPAATLLTSILSIEAVFTELAEIVLCLILELKLLSILLTTTAPPKALLETDTASAPETIREPL